MKATKPKVTVPVKRKALTVEEKMWILEERKSLKE
jgi:hypothetical protein